MAETPKVYSICDINCKWETMTREQIIAAIAEATGATPTDIDDAFITKIKEMNASGILQFWVGTTAEFNALAKKDDATLYILTDDDTADSLDEIAKNIEGIISGSITVANATEAAHATNADKVATFIDYRGGSAPYKTPVAGLYACTVIASATGVMPCYYTAMLSLRALERNVVSSSFYYNNSLYNVSYNATTQQIQGSDENVLTLLEVRLITAY